MIERLLLAMSDEGARLVRAAHSIGGTIIFDPITALARDKPPHRQCHLVKAADGWIAVNLAREEDRAAMPAWLGCALDEEICEIVRLKGCGELLDQAVLLGIPMAVVGEEYLHYSGTIPYGVPVAPNDTPNETAVLDLSALWAGPYCGALLAEAGLKVTKVESPSRPDPTASDPRLNGRKQRLTLDLTSPALTEMIAKTNILITSARPHALARLGLSEERLFALNPNLIWIAITAYGWTGDAAMRVGFGDDCAAAGGLLDWGADKARFIGDALADPLTGMIAATLAMEALAAGKPGLIDVALAQTAAYFARKAGIA